MNATWRLLIPVDFFAIDIPCVYASIAHNFTNFAPTKSCPISIIFQFVATILQSIFGYTWQYFLNPPYPESTVPAFGPRKTLFVWASESTQLTVD